MEFESNKHSNVLTSKPNPKKPHVVALPHVAQGHLIPFLELSKLLTSQGLMVSFVTTPANIARLQPQVDKFKTSNPNADIHLVPISIPPVDGLVSGIENSDDVPFHIVNLLMKSSHKLAEPFEEWLKKQIRVSDCRPVCIICGMFTTWVHLSGSKLGIPTLQFHTSGAFAISVMHAIVTYKPQKNVHSDEEYFEVPKLSFELKLRKSDLHAMMRDPNTNPMQDFIEEEINRSLEGSGVIFNTFYEMESLGLEHIKRLSKKPVWSLGPMLPASVFDAVGIDRAATNRGKAADISDEELLCWLNERQKSSVVFVCFGSEVSLNKEQVHAIAAGLERSGQEFIWAIRRARSGGIDDSLPERFEERIKDRGLIIKGWAPQLLILSHPSVGAFFSHCGWNSTLESVSLGVPMITWPMIAEQPFNSKLLEEHLGIAVQICVDMDSVPDEEVVRRAVIKLMLEEEGKSMRMRAQALGKKAKMAVGEGGSSLANLEDLVKYLIDLGEKQVVNWNL